eukprot:CAMPEP_0176229740 /NCGR_PEP_ID=MMETSP0121_2-20121125/23943_1 /TAXON_ID=160619 /ORGANISM="Kryptoperidinium foliaceum, Strain CCMP 1326" /LENGTH=55 /DNA_ID=CAMNT_0017569069 /DNA_START=33 /DNA_END=197 /DNA_ORIENTATION=-
MSASAIRGTHVASAGTPGILAKAAPCPKARCRKSPVAKSVRFDLEEVTICEVAGD